MHCRNNIEYLFSEAFTSDDVNVLVSAVGKSSIMQSWLQVNQIVRDIHVQKSHVALTV